MIERVFKRQLALWGGALVIAIAMMACGPIEYINQVTRKASSDVAAAKAVRADKFAPYWFTLAREYLHKAREEAAHSDYQAANRFGRKSSKAARKARKLSLERAKLPSEEATEERSDSQSEGDAIEFLDPESDIDAEDGQDLGDVGDAL